MESDGWRSFLSEQGRQNAHSPRGVALKVFLARALAPRFANSRAASFAFINQGHRRIRLRRLCVAQVQALRCAVDHQL
jgi:hypothetical protein